VALERIYLVPPLAFARVGASPTPCDAFLWGPNDISPRGSGTTTLIPTETLRVAADGSLSAHIPTDIVFRDEEGIRPVCPFLELHCDSSDGSGTRQAGPLTHAQLRAWGGELSDVRWSIQISNLKAFHYTYEDGDRVDARAEISADQHAQVTLVGSSPTATPLIRGTRGIPMGAVHAARPSTSFPEIRLRFHAPKGLIYGPENLRERIAELDYDLEVGSTRPNAEWRGFDLPAANLVVNPEASWPRYVPDLATLGPFLGNDYRNTPGGLLAAPHARIPWLPDAPIRQRSLGLVDDVSDGIVTCQLRLGGKEFTAVARIVVGPPDFAPANRPPVSLADNLADREDRDGVRALQEWTRAELGEIVIDILERAFETSELVHKDYQNLRSARTNLSELADAGPRSPFDADDVRTMLWPVPSPALVIEGRISAMTLSETGNWKHRRHAAIEYLEDRFRENPSAFEQWIRRPVDPNGYYDRRMPALMRGSDGRPFHLTRRQWEIFRAWIQALKADAPAAGMARGKP
jgi:hypothetical protein